MQSPLLVRLVGSRAWEQPAGGDRAIEMTFRRGDRQPPALLQDTEQGGH